MTVTRRGARSLSGLDWRFAGYTGEDWRYRNAFVAQEPSRAWHRGSVPGSVHWDLLRAGRIADPYFGENSLAAEWVGQRQWVYAAELDLPDPAAGARTFLHVAGTDYVADVFVGGEPVGRGSSLFAPLWCELTGRAGTERLSVVLHEVPAEQSQIGHSSKVTTHKPRMNYGWDFAPRLVHVGVWGDVELVTTGPARLHDLWVRPVLAADHRSAELHVQAGLDDPGQQADRVEVTVTLDGREVAAGTARPGPDGVAQVTLTLADPELWWTNGTGAQPCYECHARVLADDEESDAGTVVFGVRTVRLVQNAGDRAGALPYTLEVNGERLFLKGWNWVPVDAMYGRADLRERYEDLVALARDAGVNLLRVWGGGLIERELFYDLCDQAGILVWQEFVQSSSGLDNEPPRDPAYLASLAAEAREIVVSRRNHPSLALWCGGNELESGGRPIDADHPNMRALRDVVRELDPDRPFVPSSPSGPVFYLDQAVAAGDAAGQHDVHGPWDYNGPVATYALYDSSTALLHSEFGAPGAIARSSLDRFVPREQQWPPDATNPAWLHHGSWWLQRHWIDALFGPVTDLDDYVLLSQWLQADVLGYALDANRRRWPVCSGTLPWQLNEPWPNAHCTSAVDYYLRPKPAYWAVRDAYAGTTVGLRHSGLALGGAPLRATVHVATDRPAAGEVTVGCYELSGALLARTAYEFSGQGALELGRFETDLDALGAEAALVRAEVRGDFPGSGLRRHWLFSSRAADATPFAPLYGAPEAKLDLAAPTGRLRLRNTGPGVALFPVVDVDDDGLRWRLGGNAPVLLPGEEWETTVAATRRRQPLGPHECHVEPSGDEPAEVPVTVRGWNVPAASVAVPLR